MLDRAPQTDEPEPVAAASSLPPVVRKDPRLTRALLAIEAEKKKIHRENYQQRVEAAVDRWRQHPKETGNRAFFDLAVALFGAGIERTEIGRTLRDEAVYAHGTKSQRDRRAAIPHIMRKLKCAA